MFNTWPLEEKGVCRRVHKSNSNHKEPPEDFIWFPSPVAMETNRSILTYTEIGIHFLQYFPLFFFLVKAPHSSCQFHQRQSQLVHDHVVSSGESTYNESSKLLDIKFAYQSGPFFFLVYNDDTCCFGEFHKLSHKDGIPLIYIFNGAIKSNSQIFWGKSLQSLKLETRSFLRRIRASFQRNGKIMTRWNEIRKTKNR